MQVGARKPDVAVAIRRRSSGRSGDRSREDVATVLVAAAGVAAGAAATDSDAQAASKVVTAVLPALLRTVIVTAPPATALAATPTEAGGA